MFVICVRLCEIEGELASVYVWMYVCLCIQVIIWEGRYVWAWMLICVFVSDKQPGNGIRMCARVVCDWGVSGGWVVHACVCMSARAQCIVYIYVAICGCVLIWTRGATWYSTRLVSCLSSTHAGIATGEIESLRSWKACMQMRQIHLFSPSKTNPLLFFSSLLTILPINIIIIIFSSTLTFILQQVLKRNLNAKRKKNWVPMEKSEYFSLCHQ